MTQADSLSGFSGQSHSHEQAVAEHGAPRAGEEIGKLNAFLAIGIGNYVLAVNPAASGYTWISTSTRDTDTQLTTEAVEDVVGDQNPMFNKYLSGFRNSFLIYFPGFHTKIT